VLAKARRPRALAHRVQPASAAPAPPRPRPAAARGGAEHLPALARAALPGRRKLEGRARGPRRRARLVDLVAPLAHRGLDLGQLLAESERLPRELLRAVLGARQRRAREPGVGACLLAVLVRLPDLRIERGNPLAELPLRLDHVADLGLQAGDLGVGVIKAPLGGMHLVAGGVVGGAHRLQLRLQRALLGQTGVELQLRLRALRRDLALQRQRLVAPHQPEHPLARLAVGLQAAVALRNFGLPLQLLELCVELAQDVFDADQVLAGIGETILGLAAALLVARNAGGLLEEHPQVLGAGLDDPRDHPLADDRVGARAQPGAEEDVVDVLAAHHLVVDEVAGLALAGEHPLDREFGEAAPAAADAPEGVVEDEFDRGARCRLALGRAAEDHVLHRLAAQLRGARLAKHPAHRVHDVGLAAAVGADHAHQLARNLERGRVGEGLEASELELFEPHAGNLGTTIGQAETRKAMTEAAWAPRSGLRGPYNITRSRAPRRPARPETLPIPGHARRPGAGPPTSAARHAFASVKDHRNLPESEPGAGLSRPHRGARVHLPVPADRPAGLRHHHHRLHTRQAQPRAQEPQALHVVLP
jgi:hypothetical protein